MTADTGMDRILATKVISPGQGGERSPHRGIGYHNQVRTLSTSRRTMKKEGASQQDALVPNLVVVAQWICFVFGLACIASGVWGICIKCGQIALPAHLAWLRSVYALTLRLTAVACLVMGVVLVRRGWGTALTSVGE
jgi:hypothetical protein